MGYVFGSTSACGCGSFVRCGSQTGQSSVNFSPLSVLVIPYAHFGGNAVSTPTKAARHLITARRASCGVHPLHPVHPHECDRIKKRLLSIACPRSATDWNNHSCQVEAREITGQNKNGSTSTRRALRGGRYTIRTCDLVLIRDADSRTHILLLKHYISADACANLTMYHRGPPKSPIGYRFGYTATVLELTKESIEVVYERLVQLALPRRYLRRQKTSYSLPQLALENVLIRQQVSSDRMGDGSSISLAYACNPAHVLRAGDLFGERRGQIRRLSRKYDYSSTHFRRRRVPRPPGFFYQSAYPERWVIGPRLTRGSCVLPNSSNRQQRIIHIFVNCPGGSRKQAPIAGSSTRFHRVIQGRNTNGGLLH